MKCPLVPGDMYLISAACVEHDLYSLRPGHLGVGVGDSLWCSEEIVHISNCTFLLETVCGAVKRL